MFNDLRLPEDQREINNIKEEPMGDDDIQAYFGNANIIKYSQLKNIEHIDFLLPNDKSYFFLLYLCKPNEGHWTLVSKYWLDGKYVLEFFDPYGIFPDKELNWIPKTKREELDVKAPYLTKLFNDSKYQIYYNNFKYQQLSSDINTCGRHCCFRLLNLLKKNMNLKQYKNFMLQMHQMLDKSFDDIVSILISK